MASIYLIDAVDSVTGQTRTFHVGNFTLPRVTISNYVTLASLLSSYPDLSTDVTLICGDTGYTNARNLGFTDVVKARDLLGKTFTLRNGNTISITANGSSYFNLIMRNPSQGITYMNISNPLTNSYAFTLPSYGMCASDNSYSYAQFDLYYSGKIFPTTGMPHTSGYVGQFPPYDNALTPTDPYADVPTSTSGGGDKPYNPFDTDDVDYELLPEVSAVGTGFISLWCPTEQQMLNLSAYMWNADVLTLDFWRKLVADPIQLVYGLNIIPLDLRTIGIVGATPDTVVVGAISTGIKMDYLTSQWVELDCGTVDIDESMLGSYLDYDPFTKVDIYLPYIGYRPLRVDDIMPGTIHLKYRIDLLTGACVAQIKSTKSSEHDDTLDSIVYQYMGNCATQIPVTASQYADAVRSAITTAAAVGTIAVLAGTGAGAGVAAMGAEIMPGTQPAGLLSGPGMVPVDSELGAGMARYSQMTSVPSVSESGGGASTLKQAGIIHSAASAGGNVMGIKPSIERSGAIGGAAGMLATQIPYLVFTRPRLAHPEDQNKYTGYPSFMTKELSELSGFTQIQAIHLEGIPCTANELAEIDALLKSGVIF